MSPNDRRQTDRERRIGEDIKLTEQWPILRQIFNKIRVYHGRCCIHSIQFYGGFCNYILTNTGMFPISVLLYIHMIIVKTICFAFYRLSHPQADL